MNKNFKKIVAVVLLKMTLINSTPTDRLWQNICSYRSQLIEENILDGVDIESRSDLEVRLMFKFKVIKRSTPLITASLDDVNSTRVLLNNKANINAVDNEGNLAIHWATYYGCLPIVKLLLENGSLNDMPNIKGNTPLYIAINNNYYDIAKLLIDYNVNLERQVPYFQTYLHLAAYKSNSNILLLFLSKDNIDFKNYDGKTPLHLSTEYNNIDNIKVLISLGANINEQNSVGSTSLHIAVYKANYEAIKALLTKSHINLNIKNNFNQTALDLAKLKCRKREGRLLIKYLKIIRTLSNGNFIIKKSSKSKKYYHSILIPEFISKNIASFIDYN